MKHASLITALAVALAPALATSPAEAACRIQLNGAKCVEARQVSASRTDFRFEMAPRSAAPVHEGDVLPDDYMVLTNTSYYGLPPVRDGWLYYKVGDDIFRVDHGSRKVLERVTHMANAAFF